MGLIGLGFSVARAAARERQMAELRALDAKLQAHADVARAQASLADVLFQTERRARQVSALAARDALVAAMFSEEWLGWVARVTPESFREVEHKRAWAAATGRLRALTHPLAAPEARAFADAARAARDTANELDHTLGADPDARVAAAVAAHAAHEAKKKRLVIAAIVGGGLAVVVPFIALGISAALISAHAVTAKENPMGCLGCLGSVAAIAFAAIAISMMSGSKKARADAAMTLKQVQHAYARMRAFVADPRGGPLLERFLHHHPAYGAPLPEVEGEGAAFGAQPVATVERQTVVARCRYCGTLTPVDAPTCSQCGAHGFV